MATPAQQHHTSIPRRAAAVRRRAPPELRGHRRGRHRRLLSRRPCRHRGPEQLVRLARAGQEEPHHPLRRQQHRRGLPLRTDRVPEGQEVRRDQHLQVGHHHRDRPHLPSAEEAVRGSSAARTRPRRSSWPSPTPSAAPPAPAPTRRATRASSSPTTWADASLCSHP